MPGHVSGIKKILILFDPKPVAEYCWKGGEKKMRRVSLEASLQGGILEEERNMSG